MPIGRSSHPRGSVRNAAMSGSTPPTGEVDHDARVLPDATFLPPVDARCLLGRPRRRTMGAMDDAQPGPDGHAPASPNDVDEALEAALRALRRWAHLAGLEPLRIIGPLARLVAEQRTCALLGLRAAATSGMPAGWHATDEAGLTYAIEARAVTVSGATSFGFPREDAFDRALLVLYDPLDLTLVEVWKMEREAVLRHASVNRDRLALPWPRSRQHATLVFAREVA